MSNTLRIPLSLCDMDGLSYKEIAQSLRISLSAAKMRTKRCPRGVPGAIQNDASAKACWRGQMSANINGGRRLAIDDGRNLKTGPPHYQATPAMGTSCAAIFSLTSRPNLEAILPTNDNRPRRALFSIPLRVI
jgi:hypothetical protein